MLPLTLYMVFCLATPAVAATSVHPGVGVEGGVVGGDGVPATVVFLTGSSVAATQHPSESLFVAELRLALDTTKVVVEPFPLPSFNTQKLDDQIAATRPLLEAHRAASVLWLDLGTPGRLQLYVLLAHADRAIVRRLDAASDASAVQNLALLVREELAGSHVFATPALQQRDRSASPSPAVLESSPSPAALESPSEPLASQLPASPLLGVPMTVSIFGAGRAGLSRGSGSPPSWGGGVAMVACVSWPYTITAGVSGWLTPSYTVHGVGLRVLGLAPTVEWGWQVSALPLALEARVGVGAEYWQVSSRAPDGTHQTYGLWTAVVTAGPQVAWLVADPWRLTMGARAVVRSRAYDVSAEPSPSLLQRQAWVDAVVTVGVEHPW